MEASSASLRSGFGAVKYSGDPFSPPPWNTAQRPPETTSGCTVFPSGRKAFVTFCLRIQNPTVFLTVPASSWVQAPGQGREWLPSLGPLGVLVMGSSRLPCQLRRLRPACAKRTEASASWPSAVEICTSHREHAWLPASWNRLSAHSDADACP